MRPTVFNQAEATQKEISQQLKQALIAMSGLDSANEKIRHLEETLANFETKFGSISKVLKLQQERSDRSEQLMEKMKEKIGSAEKNEKVVADLVYRLGNIEEKINELSEAQERNQHSEGRISALEERVSRLTHKRLSPEESGHDTQGETERKILAALSASKEAANVREELFHNKIQSTLQQFQRQIESLQSSIQPTHSSPKRAMDRLKVLEMEIQSKASLEEVQRLGDILDRDIRSREVSVLDSWRKEDSVSINKSVDSRLQNMENQLNIALGAEGNQSKNRLREASKHAGTGIGSFGIDKPGKENVGNKKKRQTSAKARPRSQGSKRVPKKPFRA